MGIDGIGRSGGPPVPGTGGVGSVSKPTGDAEFRVEQQTPIAPSSDLQRLERNEITREQYVELRVEQATSHLHGRLTDVQLQDVKEQLRAQLEVDPVLKRLLQRAAGVGAPDDAGDGTPT
ncbi:MAG TPA: hypothetical protein VHM70_13235 [Polyangiaceae bacterium]|nr:hypothetical protein [Polyangiaceae bacterium]